MYYELQSGTPSAPGANNYLALSDDLDANFNGTSFFFIEGSNGFVGINDGIPDFRLDVETDTASSYVANFFNDGNNQNRYGIQVQAGADDASGTTFYFNALDGDGTQVGYLANTSGTFAVTDVSDRRTKTNIEDADVEALSVINDLRVVDFNRIQDPDGPKITGFIAQEVKEVYPEAVTKSESGYLGIMKDAFIPVVIKGIQELLTDMNDFARLAGKWGPTLKQSFIELLSDAANGIDNIFTKRLTTTEICVSDEYGQTCLDRSEVDALLSGIHSSSGNNDDDESDSMPNSPADDAPTEEDPTNEGTLDEEVIGEESGDEVIIEEPEAEEDAPADEGSDENTEIDLSV